jgi:hypothetical protein
VLCASASDTPIIATKAITTQVRNKLPLERAKYGGEVLNKSFFQIVGKGIFTRIMSKSHAHLGIKPT